MIWRVVLAFVATVAASIGILWLRGGLDRSESSVSSSPNAPREITLAVSGMH